MFLIWSLSLCVDFRLIMMIFVLATLNLVQEESQEESYVVKDGYSCNTDDDNLAEASYSESLTRKSSKKTEQLVRKNQINLKSQVTYTAKNVMISAFLDRFKSFSENDTNLLLVFPIRIGLFQVLRCFIMTRRTPDT